MSYAAMGQETLLQRLARAGAAPSAPAPNLDTFNPYAPPSQRAPIVPNVSATPPPQGPGTPSNLTVVLLGLGAVAASGVALYYLWIKKR